MKKQRLHWLPSKDKADLKLEELIADCRNKLELVEASSLDEVIAQISSFEFSLVGDDNSENAYSKLSGVPSDLRQIMAFDLFVNGRARATLREGMHEAILRSSPLDLRGKALILGCGYKSRMAVSVLAELGYSSISLVSGKAEEGPKIDLCHSYFGIHFERLDFDQVVLLPGVYSVVVNTLNLADEAFGDIFFFNYLTQHGTVISLSPGEVEKEYLTEAAALQASVIGWDLICESRFDVRKKYLLQD